MARRELILSFEGPPELVRPELYDAQAWMAVVLRFVELVEKVGAHEAVDSELAPFVVVMKEL